MAPSDVAASAADRGRLVQWVFGLMAAEVVGTAARLDLADLIGDAERTDAEPAEASGTDPGALARLLRAMAALELLVETRPGRFRLTGAGGLLRTDRRDSMHDFVRMFSEPAMLASWREQWASFRVDGATCAAVDADGELIASADVRPIGALPGRWRSAYTVAQQRAGELMLIPVRCASKVRLIRMSWDFSPGGPLRWLADARPVFATSLRDFTLRFGRP